MVIYTQYKCHEGLSLSLFLSLSLSLSLADAQLSGHQFFSQIETWKSARS